jgi:hypothetical protein
MFSGAISVGLCWLDCHIMTVSFRKNPGIVAPFDWDGSIPEQQEPIHSGVMLPANCRTGVSLSSRREAAAQ